MPKTYEVDGVKYDFPDNFSDQQAQDILTKQGVIKASPSSRQTPPSTPPPVTPAASAPPPAVDGKEGLLERAKTDLQIGFKSGVSDVAHTVANAASAVPIPAVRDFGKRTEEYSRTSAPDARKVAAHQGFGDQVLQGAAQVPSQVVKYGASKLAGKYAPIAAGAIGAIGEMDKGWKPALKAGLETAATFYAMDKAGGIKKVAPRMAASAAIMAAPAAIESGGDVTKTAAAGFTGAAFGIPSHGERMTPERATEAIKGGFETAAALKDEIQRTFAPQDRSRDAKVSGERFRERLAESAVDSSRAAFGMQEARKGFSKATPNEIMDFYRLIEPVAGRADPPVSGKIMQFAVTIRKVLDAKREQVFNETGRLKDFYINYFPHIWENPAEAAAFTKNFYASKRPLGGSGSHFKERTIPTIEEGMRKWTDQDGVEHPGLKLKHDNPVDAVQELIDQQNKFLMSKRIIKDLRPSSQKNPEGRGILQFVPDGRQIPRGFVKIDDPAFRVTTPPKKAVAATPGGKPAAKARAARAGEWVAPEAVGRIFNNYLSPGLSGSMIYRGLRAVGSTLNQGQMGLSAFHGGFTSVDSAVSRYALGVERLVEGIRTADPKMAGKGVANIASTPIAPITNAIKGWNLKKAMRDPDSITNPVMRENVELAIMAGARIDIDPVYKNNLKRKMTDAFKADKPLLAALRLPGALIEMSASPLMDHFVPWQKLGVFADMARFEMEKLDKSTVKVSRDMKVRAVQKAWDSVDNRMGQLVYDNLFWNKTAKDIGMIGIRSVGWNLGTVREVVGGAKDWGSFFKNGLTGTERAEFTHRMAYVTALPMVVGTMGAIANYLMTGQGPQEWKDYLAPRTGRKDESGHDERIWFPSYMKDMYHYATTPLGTVAGKLHPMFTMISEMLHNEDFYGVQIMNPKDPLMQELMQEAGYITKEASPFSVRTAATREQGPETPWWEKAGAFVGVVPAPASLKKSTAENYATTIMAGQIGKKARTEEEDKERMALRGINAAIRAGTDPTHLIQQAVADEILSPEAIMKSAKRNAFAYSPLFRDVKLMGLESAIDVFRMATPQERAILMRPSPGDRNNTPMMVKKILNEKAAFGKGPYTAKQKRIAAEAANILDIMKPPYGGR